MGYILADGNPSVYNFDLGFGSRLFAWAQAYYMANKSNHTVLIPSDEWVEQIFLHLPNTNTIPREHIENQKWTFLRREPTLDVLTDVEMWKIEGMCAVDDERKLIKNDPLRKIKFKEDELNEFISNVQSHYGLHLRRWGGVRVKPDKINDVLRTLPNGKIRLEYYKMMKTCGFIDQPETYDPPWIADSEYFRCMDIILKEPESKIYISTDLPKDLIGYYYDRYPNSVLTVHDYLKPWLELVSKYYNLNNVLDITKRNKTTVMDVAIDLLDFFILSKSKSFIQSFDSQWGEAARRMGNPSALSHSIGIDHPNHIKSIAN